MPLVEIEDAELASLRHFREIFDKIGQGKSRTTLLKLVKEHFPDVPIPEIDAAQPLHDEMGKLRAELAAVQEKYEKEKKEREDAEVAATANRTIAQHRDALKRDGWDDEGIAKIEAYMRETQNPDYKSAAAYVRSLEPAPAPLPGTFAGQRFEWFTPADDAPDHKLLMKDPQAFKSAEIARFLAERKQPQLHR